MGRRCAAGVSPLARVALVTSGHDGHLHYRLRTRRSAMRDLILAGNRRQMMRIHLGFEMIYDCPQPTPMMFNLNVHFTRVSDLVGRDALVFDPPVAVAAYRDGFGNWCTRIVA